MAATGFHTADELNALLPGTLPGLLGLQITAHEPGRLDAALDVRPDLLAPNGYLHAATVVGLADTACGLATRALLPEGATGFTTIELKSQLPRHRARGPDHHRGHQRARRADDAGLGRRRDRRRTGEDDRAVPLHPVGALAALNATSDWRVTPVWRGDTQSVRLAPHPSRGGAPWPWPARIPTSRSRTCRCPSSSSAAGRERPDAPALIDGLKGDVDHPRPARRLRRPRRRQPARPGPAQGRRRRRLLPEHPLVPGGLPRHRRGRLRHVADQLALHARRDRLPAEGLRREDPHHHLAVPGPRRGRGREVAGRRDRRPRRRGGPRRTCSTCSAPTRRRCRSTSTRRTTWSRCPTPAARPACPRASCSPTATWWPTWRRRGR